MSKSLLLAAFLVLSLSGIAGAQETTQPSILGLGDAVVTGFSGTLVPDPLTLPPGSEALDETLIDVEGVSARILGVAAPGYVWDGRAWAGQELRAFLARDIGQVFGIALDDAESPNIYLTATSAYGLPIVAPDADGDGRPERLLAGKADAQFMAGLFGPGPEGGPGSIWKIDGVTGEVSLFANVTLDGAANPGPGLGNIAYDAVHGQLFVSDRGTGMIHRFALDGDELGIYDHGVTGRAAAGLPTVAYDPAGALDIARGDFDTGDPDSWGYAAADRQVWGLAVHDGRLYYAVIDDSQIWSIGIDATSGAFAGDPRWELDVPKRPAKLPVSDIVFTQLGAMILAQRGEISSTYDYAGFAEPGAARLYRYWLESPDDPQTPSRWIEAPEEYAVGFGGDNRQTAGGVDLEYGFNRDGLLDLGYCEASLLTTGDDLRLDPDLADALLPGGPLAIDGLQGMPAGPVKPENTPPWASYMVDLDPVADDAEVHGHVGDVAVYRRGCGGEAPYLTQYGGAGYPSDPPYISGPEYPEDPDLPDDPEDPASCAEVDCPPPEFEILKTCDACTINPQTGKPNCQCQISVSSNGAPFPGNLSVNEGVVFGGSTPFNDTIMSVSSADAWTCDQPPFAPADPALCAIDWPGLTAAGNSSVIDVAIELPDPGFLVETRNCATLSLDGEELDQSCTDFTGEDSEEIDVSLTKSYEPDPVVQGSGSYTLTITNEGAPFDPDDAIAVTDEVPAGMTISSANGTDWDCAPLPITGPATLTCVYTGTAEIGTGFTTQVVLSASTENAGLSENCAAVGIDAMSGYEDTNSENNRDCAEFTGEDDGFNPVDDPPPLDASCGTNVIFVVDESRSIADANATYYITNALANAAAMFNANGSQAAVIRFSDNATVAYPMATATYPLVNTGYNPAAGGGTNWEAAMLAAFGLLPSPNTIIVFITDGTPTAYLDAGGVVTYTTDSVLATNEAIGVVNQIYAQGTPIVGIGIGNVSTHLNALLGGNAQESSFNSLNGDLAALAREACPDLYLRKQISPGYLDFHGVTGDVHTTVTLTVTNSSTATLTNVTVEDALPSELTNPTGFSQPATVTGSTVSWTIASLAPGATTAMNFDVIVSPNPAPTAQWRCFANYAQVTASGGTVNSTPNNMADPTNGPVHEHDEAASSVCVIDYTPVPPVDCGSSYLWVTKKTAFAEVCVPGGSPGCTFNITVTAQCKDFSGPVLFGDGVGNGGSPVAAPIASIANTASPPVCAWSSDWTGTTTPSSCTANIALPVNQSISFTVTLAAPLPAGSGYTNCFVADGKTALPADYDAAVADVNPTTSPYGGKWGNCAPFSVAAPPQLAPQQPAAEPEVICRAGTSLKGGVCVPDLACQSPARPNKAGTACVCPKDTVAKGTSCVRPEAKPLACRPPAVPNRKGTACVCPKGTLAVGGRCVTPEIPKEIIEIPKLKLPGELFAPRK
ncbi:MAG: VWA domain-containing protein [Devosia sp.]|nr:VWA domain-containing protein [Devosia sp.]